MEVSINLLDCLLGSLTQWQLVFQRILHNALSDNNLQSIYVYIDDKVIGGRNQEELNSNLIAFKEIAKRLNLQLNDEKCEYNNTKLRFLGHLLENGIVRPDPERLKPLKELPTPTCSKSLKRALGLFSYYSPWVDNFSERISPLLNITTFPMARELEGKFKTIKKEICKSSVAAIEDESPFTIETDASNIAIAATRSVPEWPSGGILLLDTHSAITLAFCNRTRISSYHRICSQMAGSSTYLVENSSS